jgi:hypothetical protein
MSCCAFEKEFDARNYHHARCLYAFGIRSFAIVGPVPRTSLRSAAAQLPGTVRERLPGVEQLNKLLDLTAARVFT